MPMAISPQKLKELMTWLLFSAAFLLGPLYMNWAVLRGNADFVWFHLFRHGELYLVFGALAADSISRVLRKRTQLGYFDIVIAAACVYVLFGSTMEFGIAAPGLLSDSSPRPMLENQAVLSVYYYGCIVIAGLASIL